MSILNSSIVPVGSTGYDIDNSVRLDYATNAYLDRTTVTTGNRRTSTFSAWVKLSDLKAGVASDSFIWSVGGTGAAALAILWKTYNDTDYFVVNTPQSTGASGAIYTPGVYRDTSAWYHILLSIDTTHATATERVILYVNGERVISSNGVMYPPLNFDTNMNLAGQKATLGKLEGIGRHFGGYLAEVNFVDGQALTPADFGETDATYGHWKPIEYAGTYGTNGFYLDFSGSATPTIVDSSSNALAVTSRGAATHDGTYAKFGQSSLKLDGTNGYQGYCGGYNGTYEFPMSSSVGPNGSNSITFDCWIYQTSFLSTSLFFAIACDWYSPNFSIGSTGLITYSNQSDGGSNNSSVVASAAITLNAWNHVACTIQNKTVKLWLNGAQVGSKTWTTGTWSNSGSKIIIGANGGGWLDEVRVSNTIRYSSTFTPETSAYTADSNTTFLIHSDYGEDNSLGADNSPNNNHWTPNNLAATDQMLDSPTNNFATINPLQLSGSPLTYYEGNLKSNRSNAAGGWGQSYSNIQISSGKWYCEVVGTSINSRYKIGIVTNDFVAGTDRYLGQDSSAYAYDIGGNKQNNAVASAYGATYTTGDVIGILLDADAGSLTFYKNNVSQGVAYSSIGADNYRFAHGSEYFGSSNNFANFNFGQDSSFAGNKTAQGNQDGNGYGDFFYEPPTGYLALCTQNLPEPTVVPSEHFDVRLRTGTGSEVTVSDLDFQPDLLWTKTRSNTVNHNFHSSLMSNDYSFLQTNSTSAENNSASTYYMTPTSTGYTVGTGDNINQNTYTFVDWLWKANGAGVSNTNGTITSTVSANADAGFSIVSYTGNGTDDATVGHGLSRYPEIVIFKNRDNTGSNWLTMTSMLSKVGYLNATSAFTTNRSWFSPSENSTWTTSIKLDAHVACNSADDFIAYAFHSVEGYSKVGSYTGNGSADGTFVHCGFRPAYVMVKKSSDAGNWAILDDKRNTYNPAQKMLRAEGSDAEADTSNSFTTDFLSNGFKCRANNGYFNASGGTYIFLAFAESDFKHSNAR